MMREEATSARGKERLEAARLLRAMRAGNRAQVIERTEWAFVAMPDNPRVQRRLARLLIDDGHHAEAESIVARALLLRPTDPSLMLLRGECLAHRGEDVEAERELRLALTLRPGHRATLDLAVVVLMRLGRSVDALPLLTRLVRLAPLSSSYRHRRIDALLAAGRVHQAAAALEQTPDAPVGLRAKVLRAQGRLVEAADVIARGLVRPDPVEHDTLRTAQITLLEELGDLQALQRSINDLDVDTPAAVIAGARALLSQGRFAEAVIRAHRIRFVPAVSHQALHILGVAAAMARRPKLATSALRKVHRGPAGPDLKLLADCWRRGLQGRLLQSQHHSRLAGADPAPSIIQPLLEQAAETLSRATAAAADRPIAERLTLAEHRDRCRAILEALQGSPPHGLRRAA